MMTWPAHEELPPIVYLKDLGVNKMMTFPCLKAKTRGAL